MKKRALLLCASHNDLGLIKALRKMGYYIIVTGNRQGLIGERFCDEYVKADYSDKDLILGIAKDKNIDAICPCCNDFGVYTAAYVAEKLELPGHDPYDTVLTLHNKDRFKSFALKHEISTPRAYSFSDEDSAVKHIDTVVYPIIVKPIDASAGNGISRANNKAEATKAIKNALKVSRKKRIVIEPYIQGTQHGFCTYLLNKKVVACCTNNEYSILNKYRVEIDTYPANGYEDDYDYLVLQIEKMADILELKDGIFHLQYIKNGEKPYIIEVMRRVLGNMYSIPASMLNGFDWDYWEAKARCGLDCTGFPTGVQQEGFFAYKAIMGNQNGTIKRISIPPKYDKYVFDKCILKESGYIIENYKSDPVGLMFLMFPSMDEMRQVLIDDYECNIVEFD